MAKRFEIMTRDDQEREMRIRRVGRAFVYFAFGAAMVAALYVMGLL